MNRRSKRLAVRRLQLTGLALLVIVVGASGWVVAVGEHSADDIARTKLHASELRGEASRDEAMKWRRQAGKAYTALLKVQALAGAPAIELPPGARFDCADAADGGGRHCDMSVIYPPADY